MPLEGYANLYQAYQAYPQIRDDIVIPAAQQGVPAVHQVAPVVQQVNPAAAIAQTNVMAAAAELARQQAALQVQLQATQAGGIPLAANHQLGYATPQTMVLCTCCWPKWK